MKSPIEYEKIKEIKRFINENFWLTLFFFLSTLFFIYQHYHSLSWDFSAYVLNAKYLFYHGSYFETLRPPLPPILLGIFLIFGKIGEYFYIIFASLIFLYANSKLADAAFVKWTAGKKIDKEFCRFLLYAFSLSYFVLFYATAEGTELLSLAFFELFLAMLIGGKVSGYYLALAVLCRYSFIIYTPLLLFNKNIKKIFYNLAGFAILVIPWLIFNYFKFGNALTSIADSYANNIVFRQHLMQPFDFSQLLIIIGWFMPFFVFGIGMALESLFLSGKKWFSDNKILIFFIFIAAAILFDYNSIPFKQVRYLFNFALPLAFLCSVGIILFYLKFIHFKNMKRFILILLICLFFLNLFSAILALQVSATPYDRFYSAAEDITALGIDNCEILSPHWVLVSYFTGNVYPLGGSQINRALWENKIVLIFKGSETMDDNFSMDDLNKFHVLKETNDYVFITRNNFLPSTCPKKYIFDPPYVDNPCEILTERFKAVGLYDLALKSCALLNKPRP